MASKTKNSKIGPALTNDLEVQAVVEFLKQLQSLTSSAGYKVFLAAREENLELQNQINKKNEEISSLKENMAKSDKNKETAINEMFEAHEKEKARHQNTQTHVKTLQKTLEDRENTIALQKATVTKLETELATLQSSLTKEKATLTQAQKDISTLEQHLKEKESTIEKLKKAESELKDRLSTVKKKGKELEDSMSSLQKSLGNTRAQLEQLEGFKAGFIETNEDRLVENFVNLWNNAKADLHPFFKPDIPKEVLQDPTAWYKFKKGDIAHRIPLPRSNTQAAKDMRLIIILAILARAIDKHIFQPTYITPDTSQMRQTLADLAATNSEKEAFCRSMLLSLDTKTQEKVCQSRVQIIVEHVAYHISDLFMEQERALFCQSVEKTVQRAIKVWQEIQHAKVKYETEFDELLEDDEWLPFAFPEENESRNRAPPSTRGKNILTIFPRICRIENNTITAYTPVIQLSPSQHQYLAAEAELGQEPLSPGAGRMKSKNLKSFFGVPKAPTKLAAINSGPRKSNGG